MAHELRDLLESALPKNPSDNEAEMQRAIEIRKELEGMGFLVEWDGRLNPQTLKFSVNVTLLVPRPPAGTC